VTEDYTRLTTVVHLRGEGTEGVGEDTTYAPPDQHGFRAAGAVLPLAGAWTLRSFAAHLDGLDLFPTGPTFAGFRPFRRWAFESAALDLALRQCGLSLAAALGRATRPLTFVHSPAPGTPVTEVRARLARYPGLRLKVAPSADWDDTTVAALAATGAVVVVDLKASIRRARRSGWRPTPTCTAACCARSPTPGSRTQAWTSARRPSCATTGTASPGTRPSAAWPTSPPARPGRAC
jgi:L-alanine-DL-glutamate epimerase-like enolase superfamily enzyme